jgi:hypothetical protein
MQLEKLQQQASNGAVQLVTVTMDGRRGDAIEEFVAH